MQVDKMLFKIPINEVEFKNMPNNEEFYFVLDLAGNKKVHRCGHIKTHKNNFKFVMLDKTQLTDAQLSVLANER